MGLCPEDYLLAGHAAAVAVLYGAARIAALDGSGDGVADVVVGDVDVRGVGAVASAVAGRVEYLTVDVQVLACLLGVILLRRTGDGRPVLGSIGSVVGRLDVLRRVETEAVNAAVDALLEQVDDTVLNAGVACVQVRAAGNVTLNDLLGIAVGVRIEAVVAEIGGFVVVELRLVILDLIAYGVFAALFLIAEVVGYDIADDLDTVLVRLGAEGGQLILGAEP